METKTVDIEHITKVFKWALAVNDGDDETTDMLVNIYSEIVNVSQDTALEMLDKEEV